MSCISKVSSSSYTKVEKQTEFTESYLTALNPELLVMILSKLDHLEDLYHTALTCKKMRSITFDKDLWVDHGKIFRQIFPKLPTATPSLWKMHAWNAFFHHRTAVHAQLQSCKDSKLAAFESQCDPLFGMDKILKSCWKSHLESSIKNLWIETSATWNFSGQSFSAFLSVLEEAPESTAIKFHCDFSVKMTQLWQKFVEKKPRGFKEISFRRAKEKQLLSVVDLPELTKLDISLVQGGTHLVKLLEKCLVFLPDLRYLHLNVESRAMNISQWEAVASILKKSRTMENIWIKGMNDIGVLVCAEALKQTRIPKVSFRGGGITERTSGLLAEVIQCNQALKVLDLTYNYRIDEVGIRLMIEQASKRKDFCLGTSGSLY